MNEPLTKEDIKSLKYECRPGILISIGIFVMSILASMANDMLNTRKILLNGFLNIYVAVLLFLIVASVLGLLIIRKFITDIRRGEKLVVKAIIQKKVSKVDYEPGSGSLVGQEMKAYEAYSIQIEGILYPVESEFFSKANEGDEVLMHIAPRSEYLLKIELIKNLSEKFANRIL